MKNVQDRLELEEAIGALRRDWSILKPRLLTLDHQLTTACTNLSIRLHYPAIRQGQSTVDTLIDKIFLFISHFCLPRSEVEEVYESSRLLDLFEFHRRLSELDDRARRLFQKARKDSGEVGELLLFILTEWVLDAPQIIAKMSLKTSAAMPVHGSDGIHVKFDAQAGKLLVFSGEAKLYKDVKRGIASAVESIGKALTTDTMSHELQLVQRNIHFAGLDEKARTALLRYLDPFDDADADRHDVVTCLIGFDFAAYREVLSEEGDPEEAFQRAAHNQLTQLGPIMATSLQDAGLGHCHVELFFLPLPSVEAARNRFSALIGLA
ncbi:HamA C-terminal domain-containing protein [Novosphingobium fluoreni]|uniref:HamA C-terminal domain-containing protein n=1 Tax=Novosphingobium fluoreni TaxID=1391222 RepID=UPI003DA0DAAA